MPTDAQDRHAQRWLLVAWCTAFVVGTDLFIVAPLLPAIARDMRVPPTSLTLLVSLFSLAYAVASPIAGRMARRRGVSRQLRIGVLILGAANLSTALAPNVLQLACSRFVAGLGAASITPMLYALAAERAAAQRRGRSLAVVSSGLVLALAGGAPLGLLLGGLWNWRLVFAGLGILLIASLPAHGRIWSHAHAPALPAPHATATAERLRDAWPLLLGMALWASTIYATYTLIGTALEAARGWPLGAIAATLACFGLGATVGSLSGGRLADRLGAAAVIRAGFAAVAIALLGTAWAYTADSPWILSPALLGVALLAYGIFPALQTLAAEQFHTLRPVVLGLMSSALYLGITIGAAVGTAVDLHAGMIGVMTASATMAAGGHLLARWIATRRPRYAGVPVTRR